MANVEIKVPVLPESIADATVATWYKKPGEAVARDENIVDLETDKVMLEVPAPESGVLGDIKYDVGATVTAGEVLGSIKAGEVAAQAPAPAEKTAPGAAETVGAPGAAETAAEAAVATEVEQTLSPTVRRLIAEHDIDISELQGSGKGGRIIKEDVENYLQQIKKGKAPSVQAPPVILAEGERPEERVPMTRLRARIAERLLQAQQNAAMLTTFNEVNLHAVKDIRAQYRDTFEKTHGVRLGFMSFFVKAAIEALKRFPMVNASIDGSDIIYHGYFDVGVAVSTQRGLVVPVLRDADTLSMADTEKLINDFAGRARDGKLALEEMTGGTFTITNGGVFGSLLSTPILNPPQSAILGMHKIEDRPVVEDGEIVVRPMMYLALSYDHRIIDGRESVQFLKTIKELLEDPARLLLEI